MDPVVGAQVELGHRGRGHPPGRLRPDQREHGAVVVAVAMDVEELAAGGRRDHAEPVLSPPLADVHDALEHPGILPHRPALPAPGGRWYGRRMGAQEWLIIAVVVLVLFGGSQLPKLARSLGEAQKEFKKGVDGSTKDESSTKSESKRPRAISPPRPTSRSSPAPGTGGP